LDGHANWGDRRKKVGARTGEAERYYRALSGPVRIGMESTGNCQWFTELVMNLGYELWIGDASRIRAAEVRQQKTDRRDAALLLENRFPRIWTPSAEQRDQRQLLLHRHKLVEMRVRVKNELQHLAMNRGITRGRRLWNKTGERVLRELSLQPWASRRREDLFKVRAVLDEQINSLDAAVAKAAEENELAHLLMTHPGVGPITSLAFVVTMGDVSRFPRGKQVGSYLGLIPREHTSGGKQRTASITKQGNRFMRTLLVEAVQSVVRYEPEFRREYLHRCHGSEKGIAKVAAARKLAIRLYWMLQSNTGYPEIVRVEGSSRVPLDRQPA